MADGAGLEAAHSVVFSGADDEQSRLFTMAQQHLGDHAFGIFKCPGRARVDVVEDAAHASAVGGVDNSFRKV
jgi:hypothetical protein